MAKYVLMRSLLFYVNKTENVHRYKVRGGGGDLLERETEIKSEREPRL